MLRIRLTGSYCLSTEPSKRECPICPHILLTFSISRASAAAEPTSETSFPKATFSSTHGRALFSLYYIFTSPQFSSLALLPSPTFTPLSNLSCKDHFSALQSPFLSFKVVNSLLLTTL